MIGLGYARGSVAAVVRRIGLQNRVDLLLERGRRGGRPLACGAGPVAVLLPLAEMSEKDFTLGLQDKLMGQVNLLLIGREFANDGASFTFTSGVINREPIRTGSSAALVNAALDGFVKAAAIELPRGLRVNSVSPTVLTEAMGKYAPYFRGFKSVAAADVALAYAKSVEGLHTGQTYQVG